MFFKYSWSNTLARIFNHYLCSLSIKISDRVYFVHPSIDMSTYQPTYQPRYWPSYGRHINPLLADILEVKSLDCQCHDQIYIRVICIASFGQVPKNFWRLHVWIMCANSVVIRQDTAKYRKYKKKEEKGKVRGEGQWRITRCRNTTEFNWLLTRFFAIEYAGFKQRSLWEVGDRSRISALLSRSN